MTKLGPRKALLLAIVFAAVVVLLSTIGPGLGAPSFTLLPLTALFIVLYFVVRWAVVAGRRQHPNGAGDTGRPLRLR